MSWNYRVVEQEGEFAIHECYYNEDGEPDTISTDPICPAGNTLEELEEDCEHYLEALRKPALRWEDF